MQQQRAIVITTQMEMSTTARITATRMNSVKESAKKKLPSVPPSVVSEPIADSESEDEESVVTWCPCELELSLLPLLLTEDKGSVVTWCPCELELSLLALLLTVNVVWVVVVTTLSTMKDTGVQVLLMNGNLISASWTSSSVAFTGK